MTKYYTIYQTENIINSNIYVGQHVTKNINDRYLGSGILLNLEIKRYGRDKFKKTILYVFDNFIDMNNKEREIVNLEFLAKPNTLNIMVGGFSNNIEGTICVKLQDTEKYIRIPTTEYHKNKHLYKSTSNDIVYVTDILTENKYKVSTKAYRDNKKTFKIVSTGYINIINKLTNCHDRILLSEYDKSIHATFSSNKVACKIAGSSDYIHIDSIEYNKNKHLYKTASSDIVYCRQDDNSVVAIPKHDYNKKIHKSVQHGYTMATIGNMSVRITTDEYHSNKHLYSNIRSNTVWVTDKATQERLIIPNYNIDYDKYIVGTSGYKTVFDTIDKSFCNIPKDVINERYKHPSSKMVKIYLADGTLLVDWFDTIQKLIDDYNLPYNIWRSFYSKGLPYKTTKKNLLYLHNSYADIVDWKVTLLA